MFPEEQFIFAVPKSWGEEGPIYIFPYLYGIDNRLDRDGITEFGNHPSEIKEALEHYLTKGYSLVEIYFDYYPRSIYLTSLPYVGSEENQVRVRIGSVSGYCNERQVIQTLYFGLLFAMTAFIKLAFVPSDNRGMLWYNQMKSNMIESYLAEMECDPLFQNTIEHILVYTGDDLVLIDDNGDSYHIPISDDIIIRGKEDETLCQLHGMKDELKSGKELALTHLSQMLPSGFDLWDISGRIQDYYVPVLYLKNAR